jgi:hypothetical protein
MHQAEEGEMIEARKQLPIGSKVVVRSRGKEGVIVRIASNGKWSEEIAHEVDCGEWWSLKGWYRAYDLLLIEEPKP